MDEVVDRARACVGTRFRLHGRVPGLGLDCVGVVAHAFRLADVPAGYPLRGGEPEGAIAAIDARLPRAGIEAAGTPGTLLLMRAGSFQLHLAVTTPAGFVHADAGLGRVVEVPGRPRWPVLACWREGEI